MPITRKQFELDIDPEIEAWMKKIHGFLAEHKDEAFSGEELWRAVSVAKEREAWEVWVAALDKLVELVVVEKRIIQGTDYYAYKAEMAF